MTDSRLYYEAHITTERPRPDQKWEDFSRAAGALGWRASRFDVDEVDHYDGAWFMSYRAPQLRVMKDSVLTMLDVLRELGFNPIRWKIEDTVLDSKNGDKEEELR